MNKLMTIWGVAALAAVALSGCGKAKMDKQVALETLQNMKSAQANPADQATNAGGGVQLAESDMHTTPGNASPGDINYMGKHCQTTHPDSGSFNGFGKTEMSVGGSECPIEWKMEQDMSNPFDVKISLHFAAKSGDAKKVQDIDSLDMTLETTTASDGKSGDLHLKMTGHSQAKGDVTLELSGHATGSDNANNHAEFNGTLTVADKAADIKMVNDTKNGVMTSESFINGEKLAGQEAQKLESATTSGSSSSKTNSSHSRGFGEF